MGIRSIHLTFPPADGIPYFRAKSWRSHNDGNHQLRIAGPIRIFLKTKEKYGGLSNMAGGFRWLSMILRFDVRDQACRFPHLETDYRAEKPNDSKDEGQTSST